jgi:nucleotide-binding universal stress UspA family protein
VAKQQGAMVTAVSALNLESLAVPIGFFSESLAYSEINRDRVIEMRRKDLGEVRDAFVKRCEKAGIDYDLIESGGAVYAEVARAAMSHDLVVLGNDIRFGDIAAQSDFSSVGLLLKHVPRPVLVAPPKLPKGTDVVVAFDGSAPSARALQMFVLLGLADGWTIRIVTVHKKRATGEAIARDAALYLDRHGVKNSAKVVEAGGVPTQIILDEVRRYETGILVMGAFGHRGWREVMLGSSTNALLGYAGVPIFVDH